MILITVCLTVFFSIYWKAFTQNVSKTPKDLLPNTVTFVPNPPAPHPPPPFPSYVEVSHETFINLALEFNATFIYCYWSPSQNGTLYTFRYDVIWNMEAYSSPAPDVVIWFGTVYEG